MRQSAQRGTAGRVPWSRTCVALLAALVGGASVARAQIKLFTARGDFGFEALGSDLAAAGDVNADGKPDWIASARRTGGSAVGYVRVYSGLDGDVLHSFLSTDTEDEFGRSVGAAGDIDGDGYDDVVLASRYYSTMDPTGRAQVFSGRDGSLLYTFLG